MFLLKYFFFYGDKILLTIFHQRIGRKTRILFKILNKKRAVFFNAALFGNYTINYFSDELDAKISNNFFVASPELILLQIAYSFANLSKACS